MAPCVVTSRVCSSEVAIIRGAAIPQRNAMFTSPGIVFVNRKSADHALHFAACASRLGDGGGQAAAGGLVVRAVASISSAGTVA